MSIGTPSVTSWLLLLAMLARVPLVPSALGVVSAAAGRQSGGSAMLRAGADSEVEGLFALRC